MKKHITVWVFLVSILLPISYSPKSDCLPSLAAIWYYSKDQSTKIWGWADSGEGINIKCSWDTIVYTTQSLVQCKMGSQD